MTISPIADVKTKVTIPVSKSVITIVPRNFEVSDLKSKLKMFKGLFIFEILYAFNITILRRLQFERAH